MNALLRSRFRASRYHQTGTSSSRTRSHRPLNLSSCSRSAYPAMDSGSTPKYTPLQPYSRTALSTRSSSSSRSASHSRTWASGANLPGNSLVSLP